MSTHARPLAVWLAAADDDVLERLFASRGVRTGASWNDFFDAAEALLEPTSIERALHGVTADEARILVRAARDGETVEIPRLQSLGLLDQNGDLYAPVAEVLRRHEEPAAAADAPPEPSDSTASALAAERAFTDVATLGDLLLMVRAAPFPLLATGLPAASVRRRLAESAAPVENLDALVDLAVRAGLARAQDRMLRLTRSGEEWLRAGAVERWAQLVTAFRDALPLGIRSGDDGWIRPDAWPHAYPWDPAWPARAAVLAEQARLLGLVDDDGREPEWAGALRERRLEPREALRGLTPAEVDRIFLQNDLSAIAPGPLAAHLDVRLRTMAVRESSAQASSYRFTAESLTRAFGEGEDEASVIAFLEEISLTGIPQPLRYLVGQTAARHGLVRVGTDAATGRTRVDSVDEHLLETISVDQALRPLGLAPDEVCADHAGLSTRVSADTVFWALIDARYPATLVGEDGAPVPAYRDVLDDSAPDAPDYGPLVAALRAHEGGDSDAAWLDRELEAAVRRRAFVEVEVGMPDGSTRVLTLEATGIGGGRLRGRDRAADVERTLPISSIRSARVLESPATP